ncbi:uncharacterized protein [Ambystoma mexicanum]|uniref:uncharacterized protein n=1 Tax=Ambystoma mexicanum TaxID=8296 RepID=UPI0037E8823F
MMERPAMGNTNNNSVAPVLADACTQVRTSKKTDNGGGQANRQPTVEQAIQASIDSALSDLNNTLASAFDRLINRIADFHPPQAAGPSVQLQPPKKCTGKTKHISGQLSPRPVSSPDSSPGRAQKRKRDESHPLSSTPWSSSAQLPAQLSPIPVSSSDSSEDSDSPPKRRKRRVAPVPAQEGPVLDINGVPFFDPALILHPRSAEWQPSQEIASFLEYWVRRPLPKGDRSKLRSECPRPVLQDKVACTPDIDQPMTVFLSQKGKDPRKGVDKAWRSCQDKLLDVLGPVTQIFEMAEEAAASNSPVDVVMLRGWIQRTVCLLGNANAAISKERRKSLLMRLDSKLADMSEREAGPSAQGNLFGESFLKDLSAYVHTFTALDKAQTNIKKVFTQKVFPRAGRGRARSSGRFSQGHSRPRQFASRGAHNPSSARGAYSQFFPQQYSGWRGRGGRGSRRSRGASDFG